MKEDPVGAVPAAMGDPALAEPTLNSAISGGEAALAGGQPVLEVNGISLAFGGTQAIKDVSFHVAAHELFAVIGPNGAGKTSIFNSISGVYQPQQGDISLLGRPIMGDPPERIARMGVSRMFQNIELFDNLTVLDNLMLGRHNHLDYSLGSAFLFGRKARRAEVASRAVVEELIDFLDIEAFRAFPVGMLPYGIKKRVELGRALAMQPTLLLLDEPVAGMNVEETEDMARFILDIKRELNIPMIMVEHDMGLVMDIADRVMVLDFGQRIALGTPEEVQKNPDVIAAYLGSEFA